MGYYRSYYENELDALEADIRLDVLNLQTDIVLSKSPVLCSKHTKPRPD